MAGYGAGRRGAASTSCSRPTSSIRSTSRVSSSRGAARRGCRCGSSAGAVHFTDERVARRRLCSVLPARPVRSARRAFVSVQHRRRRAARPVVCPPIGCPPAAAVRRARAGGPLGQRAGRRAVERDDRAGWTGACRAIAASSRSVSTRLEPPIRAGPGAVTSSLSSILASRWSAATSRRCGAVGDPRRGRGVRPRQLPGTGAADRRRRQLARCRRRRRSEGGDYRAQRHGPGSLGAYDAPDDRCGRRPAAATSRYRLCRPHLRAGALPVPRVRRLQPDRGVRVPARHRHREAARRCGARGSGGWFAGDGRDTIGRFADSDFVYVRSPILPAESSPGLA